MSPQPKILINFRVSAAHFGAYWRLDETDAAELYDFEIYRRLAQECEAQKVHALFDADSLGVDIRDLATSPVRGYEPQTFFSALAASTSRVGLIPTISTTYSEPFNLARSLSSLDRISDGRAGWNLVTTALDSAALNFGGPLPEHDTRYERAEEFLKVAKLLWTSFEDDALVADKTEGKYFDPERVHSIDHAGRFFNVKGPLNSHRTPQIIPVISQAGTSEAGRTFAGKYAEVIYSGAVSKEESIKYREDLKARRSALGRSPDSIKIFASVSAIVGSSDAEAEDIAAKLESLSQQSSPLSRISSIIGIDLTQLADSDPIPPLPKPESTNNYRSQLHNLRLKIELSKAKTVGELEQYLIGEKLTGDWVGSVKKITDNLEDWFLSGAADGFTLGGDPTAPYGSEKILREVIPELRRRGLFREEYEGSTLRENYGLQDFFKI